jgi:hypothetical protein
MAKHCKNTILYLGTIELSDFIFFPAVIELFVVFYTSDIVINVFLYFFLFDLSLI